MSITVFSLIYCYIFERNLVSLRCSCIYTVEQRYYRKVKNETQLLPAAWQGLQKGDKQMTERSQMWAHREH